MTYYYKSKKKGDVGEQFFLERHNELLIHQAIVLADLRADEWHIEGQDFGCERLILEPTENSPWTQNQFLSTAIGRYDNSIFAPKLEYGGVEVKTIGWDKVIPRTGVDGHLVQGFPLWAGLDNNNIATRAKHGNLRRWLESSVKDRSAEPLILNHLHQYEYLDRNTGNKKQRFFASVAFEDVKMLLTRLISYASSFGLDLTNWDNSIPTGEEALKFEVQGLYFQGNMWLVPMNIIGDVATVTMIGDAPEIRHLPWCPKDIQDARLAELKQLAAGRWIPQEKPDGIQSDAELFDLWHNRLFMGNPHYPNQLNINGRPMMT